MVWACEIGADASELSSRRGIGWLRLSFLGARNECYDIWVCYFQKSCLILHTFIIWYRYEAAWLAFGNWNNAFPGVHGGSLHLSVLSSTQSF